MTTSHDADSVTFHPVLDVKVCPGDTADSTAHRLFRQEAIGLLTADTDRTVTPDWTEAGKCDTA